MLKCKKCTKTGREGGRRHYLRSMNQNANEVKYALTVIGSWIWAVYAPVFPYAGVCVFLVLLGALSRVLRRRRERRGWGLSARGAGRLVARVTRVNVALLAAHLVQSVILDGSDLLNVDLLKLTAALICFWQVLDILESESTGPCGAAAREALKWIKKRPE